MCHAKVYNSWPKCLLTRFKTIRKTVLAEKLAFFHVCDSRVYVYAGPRV